MFSLSLDWDIPSHLGKQRPQTHYLRVRLNPTAQIQHGLPTRMAVALDVSSSMYGDNKLARAKEALLTVVRHLRPEDRLSVAAYSGTVTPLLDDVAGGPGAVKRSEEALSRLSADGITRMDMALDWLSRSLPATPGVVRVAILITDGEPTTAKGIPLTEEADLGSLKELGQKVRSSGMALWALGLGDPANFNSDLLEGLAPGGFLLAADPATLSQRLQRRLADAQSMATEGMKLTVHPLLDSVRAKAICRIRPAYSPLDMPASIGAPVFAGPAASDGPTDYLIEFEVPPPPVEPPALGARPSSRSVNIANIRVESANGRFAAEQPISITYTSSVSESQKRNKEVDQARLLWETNQCIQKASATSDPRLTRDFLVQAAAAADMAGLKEVAESAKVEVKELEKTGKISRRTRGMTLGELRVDDIIPRKPENPQ